LPDFAAIRARWEYEAAMLRAHFTTLHDELMRPIAYTRRGAAYPAALRHILVHVANHGPHQRSELAAMLSILSHSPGDPDMIVFFRDLPGR
jgi:uncharacterized damage-inducible protein DinB